jgi:hypothetical protein
MFMIMVMHHQTPSQIQCMIAFFMLIKVNKSFIKLLIMHFAGTGSKAGTMLIKVNKSFNIHLTVNECYILSRLKKGQIKNTFNLP